MVRNITIVLILNVLATIVVGQTEFAEHYKFEDSIARISAEIKNIPDLKHKAEKMIELSYYYTDYAKSLEILEEAGQIASKLKDQKLQTEIDIEKAMFYMAMGDAAKTVELFDKAMPKYKNDVDDYTYYLAEFQYCKALYDDGRYYETLERALSALEYYKSEKEPSVYVALLSSTIAAVYRKLGRTDEAIHHYKVANEKCDELDHYNCKCSSFRHLANISLELGNIEEAKNYIQKATESITDQAPLKWHDIFIKMTEAEIKLVEKKANEAIVILDEGFKKVKKEEWQSDIARYHILYAKAYLLKGKFQKALENSSEALRIANEGQIKSTQQAAHLINSEIFEQLGDTKKSLESFRNYHNINESILSKEKISRINEFDAKYKSDVIQNKVNKLEKENALKALEIERGNRRKLIFFGGGLFLVLLIVAILYILKRKSTTNAILKEKNQIIHKSLIDKDILLREIHHRVKNNLQVVSSLLNLQANYISDDLALEAITEGKNRVSSMALIHQNLYREENLTSINTQEYFDDLIDSIFESYNIDEDKITLSKEIQDLDIDVDTMIPLGLIVNELVTNALKHAFNENDQNGLITITLKIESNILELSVADNGKGMSKEHFLQSESFGNKIIKAFQKKLKAEIDIKNTEGTLVILKIKNYKLQAA